MVFSRVGSPGYNLVCSAAELFSFAEKNHLDEESVVRRAALSRAYYAAFHALQPAIRPLIDETKDVGRHGIAHHSATMHALRRWRSDHPDVRKRMAFGTEATKLFHKYRITLQLREQCDYSLGERSDPDAADCVLALGNARRLIEFAKKAA